MRIIAKMEIMLKNSIINLKIINNKNNSNNYNT